MIAYSPSPPVLSSPSGVGVSPIENARTRTPAPGCPSVRVTRPLTNRRGLRACPSAPSFSSIEASRLAFWSIDRRLSAWAFSVSVCAWIACTSPS